MTTDASLAQGQILRLSSIQAARAVAAISVVIYHANWTLTKNGIGFESAFMNAGLHGVDFFFVISGFIIAYVHGADIGNPASLRRYFTNRLIRIFPIFWVVMGLLILGQLMLTSIDPEFKSIWGVLRSFLLLPYPERPPLSVAWTLSFEMLFYLLFGLAILAGKRGYAVLVLWWALSAGNWLAFMAFDTWLPFPLSFVFSPYNLLFLMGILVARNFGKLPLRFCPILLAAGAAMLLALTLLPLAWPLNMVAPFWGAAFALIIAGVVRLETARKAIYPKLSTTLGDASYSMYLIHDMVMVVLGGIVFSTLLGGGIHPALQLIALIAAGIASGLCLYFIIEKPLLRLLRARFSNNNAHAPLGLRQQKGTP